MDDDQTPEELRDLLGAFALGAVDDAERSRVEAFILDDADARAELHQLEHAVAWLGHGSPRPRAETWEAIRAEIDRDARVDPAAAAPGSGRATPASVVDLDGVRRRRHRVWTRVGAVAASIALLVGVIAVATREEPTRVSPAEVVALRAPDGTVVVRAEIDDEGDGRIRSARLPAPPPGREYQLWAQPSPDAPIESAGLLGRAAVGRRFTVPPDPVLLAISVEPVGGSRSPTTDPVASARV